MSGDKEHTSTREAYRPAGSKHFAAGNPGRPAGSKNKRSIEALRSVQAMDGIAMTALQAAVLKGEAWAVQFVLGTLVPRVGRTIEVDGLSADEVIELAREGALTTGEMKDLSAAIAKLRQIDDIDELRAKIAELERYVRQ